MVKGCRMSAPQAQRAQDASDRSGLTSDNRSKEETA
jgi:hypothetical protein